MKVNLHQVLVLVLACGFIGFSRRLTAQDTQGPEATAETPGPAQEETTAPADPVPTDPEDGQHQNDSGVITNSSRGVMNNSAVIDNDSKGNQETIDVQAALNRAGAALKVDGKFGKNTEIALKKFQKKNKLKATGELDDATRTKLGSTP